MINDLILKLKNKIERLLDLRIRKKLIKLGGADPIAAVPSRKKNLK